VSKKNIKVDGFVWIAENGAIDYGFWFGDSDEPVQFATTLKEIIRNTLESHRLNNGTIAEYHLEDMKRLSLAIKAAQNIIDHEIKRMDVTETND
jgi:hypothetical protein